MRLVFLDVAGPGLEIMLLGGLIVVIIAIVLMILAIVKIVKIIRARREREYYEAKNKEGGQTE